MHVHHPLDAGLVSSVVGECPRFCDVGHELLGTCDGNSESFCQACIEGETFNRIIGRRCEKCTTDCHGTPAIAPAIAPLAHSRTLTLTLMLLFLTPSLSPSLSLSFSHSHLGSPVELGTCLLAV